MKYLIKISYDGKYFYGWNKQPNLYTINQFLEDSFKKELINVKIKASGRTDKFVHAINQVCDIEVNKKIRKKDIIKINKELNKKIRIKKVKKVKNEFSARFDLRSKTYLYKISNDFKKKKRKDENYYLNIFKEINLKKMNEDAKKFIGEKDFSSFTSKSNYYSYIRKINYIKIKKRRKIIYIEINGNGFLRYMIRHIVGSLIAKNFNKYNEEKFNDLFLNPKRGKNIFKVTGKALYLKNVKY
ncbi:MAG: tRNA pseudouridine synthase A 2 [Candidatus Hepatoplasma vulgare]|nr:MAG: tRNA pseudouridine synthase A 2 [Candidatus Hepatoplasma sp.]